MFSFYLMASMAIILGWYFFRKIMLYSLFRPLQINNRLIYIWDAIIVLGLGTVVYYRSFVHKHNVFLSYSLSFYYFFIGLAWIVGLIGAISFYAHKKSVKNNYSEQRRNFLKKNIALTGWGMIGGVASIGAYQAFYPVVEKVKISLGKKFSGLKGLRIAQISDLHVGATLGKTFLRQIVDRTNLLKADVIVITGDLVDGTPLQLKEDLQPLKDLSAPLGVFYVTGNHEFYWGGDEWIKFVPTLGPTVLDNEHRILEFNNSKFCMAGVNDSIARKLSKVHTFDPDKALRGVDSDIFKIMLSHRPKAFEFIHSAGANLQLSGHTHGGQSFPWNIIVRFIQPYVAGLYNYKGMWLYVNKGTGFWGPPNRFGISGEITLITMA